MPAAPDRADPLLLTFGMEVRRRREALGWSLDVLAEKAELSRTMLIGVEHGRRNPSLRIVVQLAQALRCGVADLVRPFDSGPDGDPAGRRPL